MPFQKGHPQFNTGKTWWKKGRTPWNKGKKNKKIAGKNHWNWKGGKIIRYDGRIMIYKPNHPHCDHHGYIHQSRFIMEKKIGRFLKPEEVTHHINGTVDDDKIENLELFKNHSEHMKIHKRIRNSKGQFI